MEENNTVVDTQMESVLDDAALAPDNGADALSEALGIEAPEPMATEQEEEQPVEETNKGLRGRMKAYEKRGYDRAMKDAESKWAEEKRSYMERLAKLEQIELQSEAKQFAQENNVPEKFALEYLQMKKGIAPTEQSRDSLGRFEARPKEPEPVVNAEADARARVLMAQAEAYEKITGGSVTRDSILDAFRDDPDIRAKVTRGEWDFTDVGKSLSEQTAHRAPKAVRTPNSGQVRPSTFANMSDSDFAKLDERIRNGAVFDVRR
jgi:hypothetical protein